MELAWGDEKRVNIEGFALEVMALESVEQREGVEDHVWVEQERVDLELVAQERVDLESFEQKGVDLMWVEQDYKMRNLYCNKNKKLKSANTNSKKRCGNFSEVENISKLCIKKER